MKSLSGSYLDPIPCRGLSSTVLKNAMTAVFMIADTVIDVEVVGVIIRRDGCCRGDSGVSKTISGLIELVHLTNIHGIGLFVQLFTA